MDWIKQNKFLSGFLIILLIAGGALGFLAFSAMGKYETSLADYQTKAQELNTLQTQQPYPEEANVKKMQEVQTAHQAAIDALQKDLVKAQIPLKPLTPEKFQDNLREAVRRVAARAAERNVQIKDNLYLGFSAYQGVPPKPEAAAPLGQLLEAVELAVNILLDSKITELTEIKRDPLPEEGTANPNQDSSGKPKDNKENKEKGSGLVQRHGFEVQFISTEAPLRNFLNGLVKSKEQFFVPASISIASELEKGPSKSEAGAAAPPPPPASADPNHPAPAAAAAAASTPALKFVVGDEKLKVAVRVEILDFAQPAPTTK